MSIFIYYGQLPHMSRFHGVQREIYLALADSLSPHYYETTHQFLFDILLKENIIKAAKLLNDKRPDFSPFVTSKFNPTFWTKTPFGYSLKPNVLPSNAISDIYNNSSEYGFECETAVVLIFYKAVLDSISNRSFNHLFQKLLVWDWSYDRDLGIYTESGNNFIPGDVVYFYNPDYDHPIWMGENAVYLGRDLYFGHGIGVKTSEEMIAALNTLRKKNAVKSAYLMSQHSRLNIRYLAQFSTPF
ncbi:protein-glutamine gamma-glutamyltransferase [Niallia endozanthoxylica]|nr:protein-glutamine gamma-glutamyltransferase [Niallia endozanthoxylica]